MEEIWVKIEGFPEYQVSNYGQVLKSSTGRIVSESRTGSGVVKVNLMIGSKQYTRSVKVLVAQAFVSGQDDIFDTAIHLDDEPRNNRADNLAWRPRWFAWKYAAQFRDPALRTWKGRIRDIATGVVYESYIVAAKENGILVKDILNSIVMKKEVWPTRQLFELLK